MLRSTAMDGFLIISFRIKYHILLILMIFALSGSFVSGESLPAGGAEPTTTDLLVNVILDEGTRVKLREDNVKALLKDPAAHDRLTEILISENHLNAKILICRVISSYGREEAGLFGQDATISKSFIEPLFKVLFSENLDLSKYASYALVRCQDGVELRLAQTAGRHDYKLSDRIACIRALELIPGKFAALSLAKLLDDSNEQVQNQAAEALARVLSFSGPFNIEEFQGEYLQKLKRMNDQDFLLEQLRRSRLQLAGALNKIVTAQKEVEFWRNRDLQSQSSMFNQLKPTEKLKMLRELLSSQQGDGANEALKVWAVEQLNQWCDLAAVRSDEIALPLIELLRGYIVDENALVRRHVVQALGKLNDEKVMPLAPALLEQLKREKDFSCQSDLLTTLGRLRYTAAIEEALRLWKSSPNMKVRGAAAEATGKMATSTLNQPDSKQLEDLVKALVANPMQAVKSTQVRRGLVRAIKDIAAVESNRKVGVKYFSDILKVMLSDEEPEIREQSVNALSDLYQQKALAMLLGRPNLLNDDDVSVCYAVITALEKYGGRDHLEALRQRYQSEKNSEVARRLHDTVKK